MRHRLSKLAILLIILISITIASAITLLGVKTPFRQTTVNGGQSTSDTPVTIIINSPKEGEEVHSPVHISGQARGFWFFEGEFPLTLKDQEGRIVARAPAQAKGEWMTSEFVAFTADLDFSPPRTPTGTLIFEHPDQKTGEIKHRFDLPVRFHP